LVVRIRLSMSITVAVAGLYEDSSQGRRLAARSTLTDLDAIVFTRDVPPALRDIDDVEVHEIGIAAEYREVTDAPAITLTGKPGPSNDWFDLAVTVSVDGEDVPFQLLLVALAENRKYLILPSGTYFSIDRPELRQLRSLISGARGLGGSPDGQRPPHPVSGEPVAGTGGAGHRLGAGRVLVCECPPARECSDNGASASSDAAGSSASISGHWIQLACISLREPAR